MTKILILAGVVLCSLTGCEAQRLVFPTPSQQRDESTRLQNQLNINSARMVAEVDERKRQNALIVPIYHNKLEEEESAMFSAASKQFCATNSNQACYMYGADQLKCRYAEGEALNIMNEYKLWIKGGMSKRQAAETTTIHRGGLGYQLAELAVSAPDDMTADEFRVQVLRGCLEMIAH
jgi:hypothetical protein